jgi:hypothetical protein
VRDSGVELNSSVFWVIVRRKVVWNPDWSFKMGVIGSPETSVLKHLTTRDNPEDGRIDEVPALYREKNIEHLSALCGWSNQEDRDGQDL